MNEPPEMKRDPAKGPVQHFASQRPGQRSNDAAQRTATPWPAMLPCHKCGSRGYRNLGTQGWCLDCVGSLYAGFHIDAFRSDNDHIVLLVEAEHDRRLTPPESREHPALMAWANRLRLGVEAGIITKAEAESAWRRVARHVAA